MMIIRNNNNKFLNNLLLLLIIFLIFIISNNKNVMGEYNNLPPESVYKIKNSNDSTILDIILPVVSVPYSPVLITVLGLESTVDLNNITIYIGKMACINPTFFNLTTVNKLMAKQKEIEFLNNNDQLYDNPYNMVIDYSQPDFYFIDDEYDETLSYLERLANFSLNMNAKTLRCDLQMVNISVNYLQAQDLYIVVNQTLTVKHNFFTFRDITPCPGTNEECNGGGGCFAGVCICNGKTNTGPQCNLQTSTPEEPILDLERPQIIYTNGHAKWMISFETLGMSEKKVEDSRTMLYDQIADLLSSNWTLKQANKQSGINGSEIGEYNLILSNGMTFTINILYYKDITYDYFFDSEGIRLYYHTGDLRIFFTLSNIPEELRKKYVFQLVFYIYTYIEESECGYVDSDFDIDFGKGFDYDDVRWAYIRSKDYALYTRLFGKCIMDSKPQSCIVDINELSKSNYEGNLKLLTYFEPFTTNVTIHHDFQILYNTKNPNNTQVCDKFEPHVQPLTWLIPTIVPIICIGLICFCFIFIYLFKANRKNLEFSTKYYFGNNFNLNDQQQQQQNQRYQHHSNNNNSNNNNNNNDSDDDSNNDEDNNNNNKFKNNNGASNNSPTIFTTIIGSENNNNINSNNNNINEDDIEIYNDTDSFEESILNINKLAAAKRRRNF